MVRGLCVSSAANNEPPEDVDVAIYDKPHSYAAALRRSFKGLLSPYKRVPRARSFNRQIFRFHLDEPRVMKQAVEAKEKFGTFV